MCPHSESSRPSRIHAQVESHLVNSPCEVTSPADYRPTALHHLWPILPWCGRPVDISEDSYWPVGIYCMALGYHSGFIWSLSHDLWFLGGRESCSRDIFWSVLAVKLINWPWTHYGKSKVLTATSLLP